MKNTFSISEISHQLVKIYERIENLSSNIAHQDMEGDTELVEVYTGMRLDELEHAQKLTLMLTEMILGDADTNAVNTDEGEGGVFAEGELTVEKTVEEPEESVGE